MEQKKRNLTDFMSKVTPQFCQQFGLILIILVTPPAMAKSIFPTTDLKTSTSNFELKSNEESMHESDFGCEVPTLEQCMTEGYLLGNVPGEEYCGSVQGENDLTCSKLLQAEVAELPAGPGIFTKEIIDSGITGSVRVISPEDDVSSFTSYSPELGSPASRIYQFSFPATGGGDGMVSQAGSTSFTAEDPRPFWVNNGPEFNSCQEFAYQAYFEIGEFWREVGSQRHDYLRTFETAFGPSSVTTIGTNHIDGTHFEDIHHTPDDEKAIQSVRNGIPRNRFLDLPGLNETSEGVKGLWTIDASVNTAPPNLALSLEGYKAHGEAIIEQLRGINNRIINKDMEFYKTYFENMTFEGLPELGITYDTGTKDGASDYDATYAQPSAESEYGFDSPDGGAGDITGMVPASFSGPRLMRRMFAAELDELYDLQQKKEALVHRWRQIDRTYAGSGWRIQDLLGELAIDDLVITPSKESSDENTFDTLQFGGTNDTGTCCESSPTYTDSPSDPTVPKNSNLSDESEARKQVLDGLLALYQQADEAGCLHEGPTYCDFSTKEFALEAVTHAAAEQQEAYELCLTYLPSPFIDNLGDERIYINPEADAAAAGIAPEYLQSDQWGNLVDEYYCDVDIPNTVVNNDLNIIVTQTKSCKSRMKAYQAAFAAFLEGYQEFKAAKERAEARARIAAIPELVDPDTGAFKRPGRGTSWDEYKGGKYFGLGMQYNYGFYSNLGQDVCSFQIDAGGDFSTSAKVLSKDIPLLDIAAWVRTESSENEKSVDIHARLLGNDLFNALEVEELAKNGAPQPLSFARKDNGHTTEMARLAQTFMLGPIPLNLAVGASGSLGFDFGMTGEAKLLEATQNAYDTCPQLHVDSYIEPYVGVYGFMEVALDVLVAAAGVRGEMTILKLSTPVDLSLNLEPVNSGEQFDLGLDIAMSVATRLESLSGLIAAFGEIGPCPVCKRVSKNIVKWDGFTMDKQLYGESYSVSIDDLIKAMEEEG